MVPSLPADLTRGTRLVFVEWVFECAMLRGIGSCGDDTDCVLICPQPGERTKLIPICIPCIEAAGAYIQQFTGEQWLDGLRKVAQ